MHAMTTLVYEIIGPDRVLLHTGTASPAPGMGEEELLVEAFVEFAELKSIPRHEMDGMVAVGWLDTRPADKIEVYGSEWRA